MTGTISGAAYRFGGFGNTSRRNVATENENVGFEDPSLPGANTYIDNICIDNGGGTSAPEGLCSETLPAEPQPTSEPGETQTPDVTPPVEQDPPASLVTELIEPGVKRIVRDDAGHDLDERHPTKRWDMDGIAIAPDGRVWITSSASGGDNQYQPGALVWALGLPGTYTVEDGVPGDGHSIVALDDGTVLVLGHRVVSFYGERWRPYVDAVPGPGPDAGRRARMPDGSEIRVDGDDGLVRQDASGEQTRYLEGTPPQRDRSGSRWVALGDRRFRRRERRRVSDRRVTTGEAPGTP